MIKPYRKTEAGEMAKWFKLKIKERGLTVKWKIKICATELSALENMLAIKSLIGNKPLWYFCEQTREIKMRALARKIFSQQAKVIPIEFDASPARYDDDIRKSLEKEDLQYSLLALEDKQWRRVFKKYSQEKIRILRNLPPGKRRLATDRIARDLKREFYRNYRQY